MPNSFCRTPCGHCYCSKFRDSVFSVVFVRQFQSRGHSVLGALHAAFSPWPAPPHARLASSRRRWRPGRPRRRVSRRPKPRCSRQGTRTTAQRRSAPPIAPWLSAWPHARQRTPAAPSPWPDSTGRALCRQRTRAVPFPTKACPKLLIQVRLASKRTQ